MTSGQNKLEHCGKEKDVGLLNLRNWSGVNVIVFKTVNVFETVGSSIDKYACTAIVGGVQLVATGSK